MPRARRADGEILEATLDVISERGVAGTTVEGVAERAQASKATIYRRWRSRAELIHAALSSLESPQDDTEGSSVREDMALLLGNLVDYFNRRDIGRIFPSFIDAASRDPELAELHEQTLRRGRDRFEQVVRRGIESGELPRDLDVSLFVDVVRAPVIYRRVVARAAVTRQDVDALLDLVLGTFDDGGRR